MKGSWGVQADIHTRIYIQVQGSNAVSGSNEVLQRINKTRDNWQRVIGVHGIFRCRWTGRVYMRWYVSKDLNYSDRVNKGSSRAAHKHGGWRKGHTWGSGRCCVEEELKSLFCTLWGHWITAEGKPHKVRVLYLGCLLCFQLRGLNKFINEFSHGCLILCYRLTVMKP